MSLYLGENLISGVATPIEGARNIGQIIQSTIPLSDAGLHLLDGALIPGGGIYNDFVQYISGLVNTYSQCFTDETSWQNSVNTYGVCGKFVYDSVNNTVRLPKITGFTEGTIDVTTLGDYIQAGLPNITGNISANKGWGRDGLSATGAFRASGSAAMSDTINGYNNANNVTFDASRSSSIYGRSSTVQPQSIKVLYYIVIATSTKTNIQVDIDEIATDLNGKADVDLSNCTKPYITETYVNGTSWYRVYSDGWCEQGGVLNKQTIAAGYNASQTLTFLKEMVNTNYTITFGAVDGTPRFQSATIAKTTTGGTVWQMDRSGSGSGGIQFSWIACGYIS